MVEVIITFRKSTKTHLSVGPALIGRVGKNTLYIGEVFFITNASDLKHKADIFKLCSKLEPFLSNLESHALPV